MLNMNFNRYIKGLELISVALKVVTLNKPQSSNKSF